MRRVEGGCRAEKCAGNGQKKAPSQEYPHLLLVPRERGLLFLDHDVLLGGEI